IIEIIRESPNIIGTDTVLDGQLSVHNKGCAATRTDTIVKEILSTGWTPANPTALGEVTLNSEGTGADLINNILTWNLSTIGVNEYALLTYQVKSPTSPATIGGFRYNATWEGRALRESPVYILQTLNYSGEAHLQFDLETIQQGSFPWNETRSAQLNRSYNYSLEVKNIGGATATGWNVTLDIPYDCNISNATYNINGNWNETNREITWNITDIAVYGTLYLNFTMNCTIEGKHILTARGIKNTTTFNHTVQPPTKTISCSTITDCENTTSLYNFTKPTGAQYEELTQIDLRVNYNWSGNNLTIGEGYVNITDDWGKQYIMWQNYSHDGDNGTMWANFTINDEDQKFFTNDSHDIGLKSFTTGTANVRGNVTVDRVGYTWRTGKMFEEETDLFVKIKEYVYYPLFRDPGLLINWTIKTSGGWGENFSFNISTGDRFERNVTVYGWHSSAGGPYIYVDNYTCVNCVEWSEVNFTYDYNGTDDTTWTFKFNATNADGDQQSTTLSYTVEKDDINADYITPAYNATINRSLKINFSINIWDTDNNTNPGYLKTGEIDASKGVIYFSRYGSGGSWDTTASGSSMSSNDTGGISRQMENSSLQWCESTGGADYPLGQTYWYGGVTGANAYKQNLTTARPFMLIGDLYIGHFTPNATNYTLGSAIPLQAYTWNDCGSNITAATVIFNLSSGTYQTNQTVWTVATNTYENTSYTLPPGAPSGWYNVTINVNMTDYWNATYIQEKAFYYGTSINLTNQNMSPYVGNEPSGGWGESPFRFNVTVQNNQTTRAYLELWNTTSGWFNFENATCSGSACNASNISIQRNFTCEEIGNWSFKFNATDESGKSNDALGRLNFSVERDDNTILLYTGNNSIVNRSNTLSDTSVRLSTMINDTDNASFTTEISNDTELYTYVSNGSAWEEEDESKNITNTTYYLDFNPGCNYLPGNRTWNMTLTSASCYKNQTSLNYTIRIIGDLNGTNISNPDGNTNYTQGNSILLRAFVADDCSRNMSGLSTVYFNLSNGTDEQLCSTTNDEKTGWYNCTWASAGNSTGWYNISFHCAEKYRLPILTLDKRLVQAAKDKGISVLEVAE
ncbi:MAG: hypothetical protein ABIH92_04570, partial [Nanoarchaeota archaeon]